MTLVENTYLRTELVRILGPVASMPAVTTIARWVVGIAAVGSRVIRVRAVIVAIVARMVVVIQVR